MKHNMNKFIIIASLLLTSLGAWAAQNVTTAVEPSAAAGTLTYNIENGVCTLTATPASGYYLTKDYITAVTSLDGAGVQSRRKAPTNIDVTSETLVVSATSETADPSGVTTYTFDMPEDENINVTVTAEFQTLIAITPTVTLEGWTFGQAANTPVVSNNPSTGQVTFTYAVKDSGEFSEAVPTAVGNYTVKAVVAAAREYAAGEATADFNISAKAVTDAMIADIAAQTYDGTEKEPVLTVTDGNTQLVLGTDYSVAYTDNVNAGTETATATITGKGNYSGTASKTFTINKAAINPTFSVTGWVYGSTPNTPVIGGTTGDGVQTVSYKLQSEEEYSTTVPTAAGWYNAKLEIAEGTNYLGLESALTDTFCIAKATPAITQVPVAKALTYTGVAQALVEAGTVSAGTLVYSKTIDGTFAESIPEETNAGTYSVYYKINGNDNYDGTEASESDKVSVTISPAAITEVTLSETTLTYTGAEQTIAVSSVKADTVTLGTSDYTVSGNTATTPGTYTVTVTAVADGNFSGSATADFTIGAKSIAGVTIADIAAQDYTGSAIEPAVTVTDGSTPLVLDTDYTVSYSNNVNAGEATVTITGKGNYDSATTATKHFTISPVSLEGVTIAAIADQAYTGEAVEPAVSVTFNGKAVSGEEYTVGYSSNTEAGEATVTLTSTGKNFTAGTTKSATFQIIAATATLSGSDQTVTYNGAAQSYTQGSATAGTLVVTYYVTEADRSKGSNGTTDAPTAAGTYYVRLSQGDANYSSAPVDVTFTIVPAAITSVTLSETTLTYTGTEQTVSVSSVKAGDLTLTASDYTLSGNTATDAGTYTVTVTATTDGNFTGSSTAEFNIVQASFADVEIAAIADQAYTGSAIEPAVTVTFNDNAVASDDYTVSYSNNTNAGEALVTLTSTGKNFTEGTTKSTTFQIVAVTATITGTDQSVTYDGQSHAYTNGSISEGTLVITYYSSASDRSEETGGTTEAPTNAGTYFVRLSQGDANFASVPVDVTFTIAQAAITSVTLAETSLTYTGAEQTVAVSEVKAGDLVLTATDYIVSGNTATDAGTYTVTVTAVANGNFTGEATASFTIINRTISQDEIAFAEGQTFASYYSTTEDLELPEGLVAYIVTGVTATTVTTQAVSYIPKNVPVLVEKTASSVETVDVVEGNLLHGTTAPTAVTSITEGTVYVLYNNEFVKSVSGIIPANRCYLVLDNQTAGSRLRIVGSHDASGIQLSTSIEDESAVWYDQNGRMLNGKPVKKGLYLQKGKKILVK